MNSPKPKIGDMYRLPDLLTGFSGDNQKQRWCMVVHSESYSVRVAPRSAMEDDEEIAEGDGVYVPKEAMSKFTKNGRFYNDWKSISLATLRHYEPADPLPEEYRERVVEQYRVGLAHRRELRRKGPRS